jgi:hypothetical protein
VQGCRHKTQGIIEEIERLKISIGVITETKKRKEMD